MGPETPSQEKQVGIWNIPPKRNIPAAAALPKDRGISSVAELSSSPGEYFPLKHHLAKLTKTML